MKTLCRVEVQLFEDQPSGMEASERKVHCSAEGERDVLMSEMEKKRANEDKYYG